MKSGGVRPTVFGCAQAVCSAGHRRGGSVRLVKGIGGYYDFIRNHRRVMELLLHDLGSVARVGTIVDAVLSWRERLSAVLFGPEPAAAQRAMAVVAFGGVMDAAAFDRDGDPAFKEAVVGAALRALSG